MDVGTAWIVSPQCHQPVKIKIPFADLGDYPSESEIAKHMKPLQDSWDARTVFAPIKTDAETKIDFRKILGETPPATPSTEDPAIPTSTEPAQGTVPFIRRPNDPVILAEYFAMLRSCETHPDFGAAAHYKALGWSAGRGNRVKIKLIELRWIEAIRIASPKGGRPKETLHLTEKGKGVLDEPAQRS